MTPRLFLQIVSLEARTKFSYRVDFWINTVVGFSVELFVAWFLWKAVFEASGAELIGGRTFPQMVVYVIAAVLLGKFAIGRDFEGTISGDIYEGGLNRYLLFPANYVGVKYAQQLGRMVPLVVQVLLFGAFVVPLLGVAGEFKLSFGSVAMAMVALAVSNLLNFLMVFPLQATAFWADNVWSLMVAQRIVGSILGGFLLPLSVFPDAMRTTLEYLPWRFFYDFPARVMLGEIGFAEWLPGMALALGWCVVFRFLGRAVWNRGLYQYSGVGI
ncbi:MAG: ABC-2 family transporter protein [Planctomycetota bacterium]